MATILLTAAGTFAGGPLGGAIGALAGRQIDAAIAGNPARAGPRLKELSVTTSSYGQPVARHFGRVRASGTVIWATELVETSETSGGGKGKPKSTSFSYSISFAVALSSRPIYSVGRIWADGNLLRGSAGDLKAGGLLRTYNGYRDQLPDPLISAAQGLQAPAFRGLAYVVFENLALGDFGNRIPALTFEIFADEQGPIALSDIAPDTIAVGALGDLPELLGFSDEGGDLAGTLSIVDQVFDIASVADGKGLSLKRVSADQVQVIELPEEIMVPETRTSTASHGRERTRATGIVGSPTALRYYDPAHDYQIGIQRALGDPRKGLERTVEFPGTLAAEDARSLSLKMAQDARWRREQLTWRIAELNPELIPGKIVKLPGQPGHWVISSWEWLDRGVELALERIVPTNPTGLSGDPGTPMLPKDLPLAPSQLWTFELPLDGTGAGANGAYFAALSAENAGWTGASLYLDQAGALLPLVGTSRNRSVAGTLALPLTASKSQILEQGSTIEAELIAGDLGFASSTAAGLAAGANRLLVGAEVVQFLEAEQLTETRWKLSGLLRGRGGTEHHALAGHPAGREVVLLDDTLIQLDAGLIAGTAAQVAAIGLGDDQPVVSRLQPSGISLNPPAPVHARMTLQANGDWQLRWARRGRGQWRWPDLVDTPLVEESELYQIGLGPVETPLVEWTVTSAELLIDVATITQLAAIHGTEALWVRQIGTYGKSPATFIASIT
ncbi:MAG: hypothetical protein APF78_02510 [Sphingomonadales bacterium BRH_c3]|nr:MAG: hypothetical protein APF78_02510 [Sphingomonadales bacterium BRH_c3]